MTSHRVHRFVLQPTAFSRNVGLSAFYVSFVLTPVASNASEVISGLIFASKRTNKAMSLTLTALYGQFRLASYTLSALSLAV